MRRRGNFKRKKSSHGEQDCEAHLLLCLARVFCLVLLLFFAL